MRWPGFCGPANRTLSPVANAERTVNLYQERNESEAAPFNPNLYPTPGQTAWIQTSDVGGRGFVEAGGRGFGVIGGGFWEVKADGTKTRLQDVAQDEYPATFAYNAVMGQLLVGSGGNAYLFTLATNAWATVLTGEAHQVGFLNGRFLAFNRTNQHVRMSELNDGATWDPLLWFGRTQASDPWVSMLVRAPEIWLIGTETGEVWYDSGAYPQPFAPINGAFFPSGTCAAFSAAVAGDQVTWVQKTKDGAGSIVAARGYAPQEISNYAVQTSLAPFDAAELADAEVMVYAERGHLFAVWTFQRAGQTWCFDFKEGAWHERCSWDAIRGQEIAWKARQHGYLFGRHVVGARDTGLISILDPTAGDEHGDVIRRVRVPPPIYAKAGQPLSVDRLEVYLEPGLGTASGQGVDPTLMLRTSKDGKTWGSERTASAGQLGEYGKKVVFTRCGATDKLFVCEVSWTDPVPLRLLGAEVNR